MNISTGKTSTSLRIRQRLGKYRITARVGHGGFACVYKAMDTIEGISVALKVPHDSLVTEDVLKDFRHEVRTTAKLDHPNILPLKDASFIDERLVIAFPLAEKTLDDRLRSRVSIPTAVNYAEQILEAVAYAHRSRIIHCDIKPENVLLFPDNRLRLTDFGIAKVAQKTVRGSGTGTVGYMAPEQAMGKPSKRSDVFSVGLLVYRMLTGKWPEYPYEWPVAGYHRLRGRIHPDMIALLKRAIEPNPRKRFRDADQMLTVFKRIRLKTLRHAQRNSRSTGTSKRSRSHSRAARRA